MKRIKYRQSTIFARNAFSVLALMLFCLFLQNINANNTLPVHTSTDERLVVDDGMHLYSPLLNRAAPTGTPVNTCIGIDIDVSSVGYNNTAGYELIFYLVNNTTMLIEAISPDVAATGNYTFPTGALTAGTQYNVHALNYDTGDIPSFMMPALAIGDALPATLVGETGCFNPDFLTDVLCYLIVAIPDIAAASNTPVCSGTAIAVDVSNTVGGGNFNWTADYGVLLGGAGSGNGVAYMNGAITETLTNWTTAPVTATYTLTPIGIAPSNCEGTPITHVVTVNPTEDATFNFIDYCAGAVNAPLLSATAVAGGTFAITAPADAATIVPNTGVITGGVAGTTYTVEYTTPGTCTGVSTHMVTVVDCTCTPADVCEGLDIDVLKSTYATTTSDYALVFYTVDAGTGLIVDISGDEIGDGLYTIPNAALIAGNIYNVYALNYDDSDQPSFLPLALTNAFPTNISIATGCFNEDLLTDFLCYQILSSSVTMAASNTPICSGGMAIVDVTNAGGGTFSWSANYGAVTGGAGSASGVTYGVGSITETLTNPLSISINVTYTITPSGGCGGAPFTHVVTVDPAEDASFTFTDFCVGSTNAPILSGTAVTGGTFSITDPLADGASIAAATGEISTPVAGETYTVQYTTPGTCTGTSTQTVTAVDCTCTPANVCEGLDIDVMKTGYSMEVGGLLFFTVDAATDNIVDISGNEIADGLYTIPNTALTAGETYNVYTLNYDTLSPVSFASLAVNDPFPTDMSTVAGCYNDGFLTDFICYTIVPTPVASASSNTPICSGADAIIDVTNVSDGITFNWFVSNYNGVTGGIGTTEQTGVTFGAGAITETLTNGTGASVVVTYSIIPVAGSCLGDTITHDVTVNLQEDATFTYGDFCSGPVLDAMAVALGTYSFDPAPGDGALIDANTGVISSATLGAMYTVRYTTPGPTCPGTSTVTVTAVSCTCPTLCPGTTVTASAIGYTTDPNYDLLFIITDSMDSVIAISPKEIVAGGNDGEHIFMTDDFLDDTYTIYTLSYDTLNPPLFLANITGGTMMIPTAAEVAAEPAASCFNSADFLTDTNCFTVLPAPNAMATDAIICSGETTAVTVTNPNGVGGTYAWSAVYGDVTGGAGSASGLAFNTDIAETLFNATAASIDVIYTLTPTGANTCVGPDSTVTVTVNPLPTIAPPSPAIEVCSTAANAFNLTIYNTAVNAGGGTTVTVTWFDGEPDNGGAAFTIQNTADLTSVTELWVQVVDDTTLCPNTMQIPFTILNVSCTTFPWNGSN